MGKIILVMLLCVSFANLVQLKSYNMIINTDHLGYVNGNYYSMGSDQKIELYFIAGGREQKVYIETNVKGKKIIMDELFKITKLGAIK